MRLVAWVTLGGGLIGGDWSKGQAPVAVKAPVFEVASVRLSPPGGDGMTAVHLYDGPQITVRNARLEFLVQLAFGVDDYQIAGLPKWAEDASYDISAKTDGTVALNYEQLKPLLQKLLRERLQLTVHRTMKDFKGYGLVVTKGGPKLVASTRAGGMGQIFPGGLRAGKIDLKTIASMLGHATGRPTVDKTGISGEYDLDLQYAPEGATDSALPSLFTALQEQMGLRLETQMVPVEMLVMDAVERVPAEN